MTGLPMGDQMPETSVAVVGASGFVGAAVVRALEASEFKVAKVRAPRLATLEVRNPHKGALPAPPPEVYGSLLAAFQDIDVVVNAAGISDAQSRNKKDLFAANSVLPMIVGQACRDAKVQRFIHISSAAVQGDLPALNSAPSFRPRSPYAKSKTLAERWLLEEDWSPLELVIFRPPGVHAQGRSTTDFIMKLGARHLLAVSDKGQGKAPQALLGNVADAIASLAFIPVCPPRIVHHPWEGLSTYEFVELTSGRPPRVIPTLLARSVVRGLRGTEKLLPGLYPHRRRIEVLWFGQEIERSWLEEQGWHPPHGVQAWSSLG